MPTDTPRTTAWLRRAALGLVVLATMEAGARLDDWVAHDAPLATNYEFEQLFAFDGHVVRGVPHAHYAKWRLNGLGLRGPEPARGTTGGVLVYGASEVFGLYEDTGREFPRALEQALADAAGPGRHPVFNAGIPGMRIGSGTGYLKALAGELHPAVVVLYPTPTHYIGTSRPNCGRPTRAATPADTRPQSRLLQKAVDRAKAVLPAPAMTLARRASIAWTMRGQAPLAAIAPESLAALETDLACAVQAVRAIGATPLLVTHANRFGSVRRDDDARWLTGWRMQYPELEEGGFLDLERRANDVVAAVAARLQVPLADADASLSGEPANFADHAHFSNQGAARMGALLARAVLALPGSSGDPAPPASTTASARP
jgi:hypothetical protein